jgi:hypothetical protein
MAPPPFGKLIAGTGEDSGDVAATLPSEFPCSEAVSLVSRT